MKNFNSQLNKSQILEINFYNKNKNSFSPQASDELIAIIRSHLKKIKGVLFYSSNPGFFCVGGDLKFYSNLDSKKPGVEANKKISKNLSYLYSLQIPKLVIVDGLCLGGGVELISCFDQIISSPESCFSLWQRKIGLSFGWGGGERLASRVSNHQLKKIFLTTELLSSYKSKKLGIVDEITLSYQAKQRALDWFSNVIDLPSSPIGRLDFNNKILNEQTTFEELWLDVEHRRALNKFINKS